MENYEKPSGVFENDEDYFKQEIEIEVSAFAYKQMKEFYEVQTIIPEIVER